MAHFAGLDVSVKETSVCVVDDAGRVISEQKVPTEPADIIALLTSLDVTYSRIGIEAGPLSQWLVTALTAAELPVICVETRHMKALLTAQQINKTDRNDARRIAQMMRVGLFKPVHVKTLVAQEQRMLLTSRKLLQRKLLDLESDLRGTLRNFGLKVGVVSGGRYEVRVRELIAGFPRLAAIAEPLLKVRQVMRQQLAVLHKMLLATVRDDPVCPRLVTAPASAKQQHNACYQFGEATIRYGFHPRCGETVIVTGRNRRGDEVALTVRQPDGTLAQMPIWMTEDRAAAMMVREIPRLPLACLRELRLELDAWQSLLRDEPRREGDKHAASAAELSPARPLLAQGSTGAGSSVRSGDAVATGERAPGRDVGRHR